MTGAYLLVCWIGWTLGGVFLCWQKKWEDEYTRETVTGSLTILVFILVANAGRLMMP